MGSNRIIVKTSLIHGRGVFAQEAIARGECIATFEGRPTQRDGAYVLWIEDEDGSEVGIRGTGDLRFLNHSTRANAEFQGTELYALRAIRPGQEITLHYGDAWDDVD